MSTGSSKEGGGAPRPKKARQGSAPIPRDDLIKVVSTLLSRLQPEFRSRETPADADHRRKKEFLGYIIKELSPFAVAILFIFATGFYCFYVLLSPSAPQEAQQRAWAAFTILLSGVVGFVFGKTAAK
jgi:hypothetical protein